MTVVCAAFEAQCDPHRLLVYIAAGDDLITTNSNTRYLSGTLRTLTGTPLYTQGTKGDHGRQRES